MIDVDPDRDRDQEGDIDRSNERKEPPRHTYDHLARLQGRLDRELGPVCRNGGVSDLFRGGDGHLRAAAVIVEVREG
jgi:hypothetical protein